MSNQASIVGEVLHGALRLRDMSQSELATAIGKSAGYISHIVSGRKQHIDPPLSAQLSKILKTRKDFWFDINTAERAGNARTVGEYLAEIDGQNEIDIRSGVLVDYQIEAYVGIGSAETESDRPDGLVIDPFFTDRLRPSSYDTCVGGEWLGGVVERKPRDIVEKISIDAGQFKHIYTEEHFIMPSQLQGRIAPAGSFLMSGVIVSHGPIIDPLFEGKLTVTIHNFTSQRIDIYAGVPFITVVFERLAATPQRPAPLRGEIGRDGLYKHDNELMDEEQALLKRLAEIRSSQSN